MGLAEPRITIALATWNGARWLPEQLASLASQTMSAHVVAGDDGSTDGTLEVLSAWRDRLPGGLTVLPPAARRLGAAANFGRILAACDGDWVACCDQDDVWAADHLAILLAAGSDIPADRPRLVVGDLAVVNAALQPVHSSFRAMQAFDGQVGAELRSLAVMNCFPGCAMLADRALLRAALPLPETVVMHDWWLALTAAALGQVVPVTHPVGRYRIHEGNALGAQRFSLLGRLRAMLAGRSQVRNSVIAAARQAQALLDRHQGMMDGRTKRILTTTAALASAGWIRRRWLLSRGIVRRHPWARQAQLFIRG